MQNKTTREKIVKFFSIIKYNKKNYFFYIIQAIIRWINPLIHVIFIEKIVYYLNLWNSVLLQKTLLYYIIAIFLFEFLWIITRKVWWVISIPWWESKIYETYLKKFVQMDNNSVEKMWIWKIIAILENWRLRWSEWLSNVTEKWIALLILLSYVIFITSSHWYFYTLWFFVLLIFSVTIMVFVNKNQFKFRNKRSEIRNNRLKLVTKILMSKNEILQTNRINYEVKNIDELSKNSSEINLAMANWRIVQNRLIPFIIWISLFFFVFTFWKEVIKWNMLISEFVAITSIFLVINSSVNSFLQFYIDLTKDFIDIEKMWDFFDNTPSLSWYDTWNDFVYKNGNIILKNLSYWYNQWQDVFKDFNLEIKWWKITAFVWNSWSWKSTLVKLISWYIKANNGEIIIDNQKLYEISLKSYYKYIGYLTQEPSVFDWTILDNLTYAITREVSREELDEVIKLSVCDFIYDLPKWLETQIWEKWIRLSWWQRQRLAIAKIMLKDPKIIILDEPTSSLDSFSEELITKAMNNLFKWKTVLVIAHRLQTVKHADEIIVIENWKIVERWKHNDLVKQNWIYNRMLELQSGF